MLIVLETADEVGSLLSLPSFREVESCSPEKRRWVCSESAGFEGTADEVSESLLCCFLTHERDENIEKGYEAFQIWIKKEQEIVFFLACLIIEGTKEQTRRHWTAVKRCFVKIFFIATD